MVYGATEAYSSDDEGGGMLESIAYSGGGSRSFTYDLAGRMLTDTLNSRAFAWTADSRLASVTASTGNESYTYSPFGTRAKVGSSAFLRAGAEVTAPVLADGNASYTPGVSEVRNSVTTYSHSGLKHMGVQSDASSSGSPAVQATRTYDAFGATQSSTGSWQGPFGTAGAFGYQSPQTGSEQGGLHLLGHRYYDASTGRFLTRDPIGDGSNWYAYCDNDPISFADPSGRIGLLIDGDSDFFAGWGDELTEIPLPGGSFSGTDWVRGQLGVNEVVDKDGAAYKWGRGIGFVHGLVKGFAKKGLKLGFDGARSIVIEKHHEIPRAVSKRLRHLEMDEFKGTVPIPKDVHRDWHSVPGKGGYYNTLWRDMLGGDWKRSDWDRVTDDDVRKALDEFRRNFGF